MLSKEWFAISFFTCFIEVKMSLPNEATNDIIYYHYPKNNSVTSRSMIEFSSLTSIRLNEAQAISLIYLQVVCNRERKQRKTIKWKAEIQKNYVKEYFQKTCFISKYKFLSPVKMFCSKSLDISERVSYSFSIICKYLWIQTASLFAALSEW